MYPSLSNLEAAGLRVAGRPADPADIVRLADRASNARRGLLSPEARAAYGTVAFGNVRAATTGPLDVKYTGGGGDADAAYGTLTSNIPTTLLVSRCRGERVK